MGGKERELIGNGKDGKVIRSRFIKGRMPPSPRRRR